ncbi:hypothetical protein H5123_09195 [Shewanella sp. SR43-4]|jgi:hypothetical protein|uniref:hypothetical protein n=1 Tax=Shewanella sp. SR43-4 TaxID=2760942 RepID=UPI0015FE4CB7|nr:hypothetical protein [Shewanella sp. SR43-4]MBB1317816.1 hypothetical protein [Shewanella sp. SR43-4]
MNNLNNDSTTNTAFNPTNLFGDVAVSNEHKSPSEWTLEDCKSNLQVIFKESKNADEIDVSVRLQGLTMLRLHNGKTVIQIKKGALTKEEVLERVIDADSIIVEAQERLKESLRKAKTSRETTHKRNTGDRPAKPKIEEDGQGYPQPPHS